MPFIGASPKDAREHRNDPHATTQETTGESGSAAIPPAVPERFAHRGPADRYCRSFDPSPFIRRQQPHQILKTIGIGDAEVAAPAVDPREAQCNPGLVTRRARNALEGQFEHVDRLDRTYWPET